MSVQNVENRKFKLPLFKVLRQRCLFNLKEAFSIFERSCVAFPIFYAMEAPNLRRILHLQKLKLSQGMYPISDNFSNYCITQTHQRRLQTPKYAFKLEKWKLTHLFKQPTDTVGANSLPILMAEIGKLVIEVFGVGGGCKTKVF